MDVGALGEEEALRDGADALDHLERPGEPRAELAARIRQQ
jgi:hypothetical protein